jgi:salicylate hydroxylase
VTKLKILIAGAGIGGLNAAAHLLKAGHDVTVFEQAPELAEVGAGIQISANAMHGLIHLGLGPAIAQIGVRPKAYVFKLFDSGEAIQRFALSHEHERLHRAPYVQMHRADLHNALAGRVRELSPHAIRLNQRVVGFREHEKSVEIRFADGKTASGDLLIGADGLKSVAREQIAGKTPASYTGDAAWRVTLPASRVPPGIVDEVMSVWMGPGGHFIAYYIRAGGALLNFVGLIETPEVSEESWTAKFAWSKFKGDFAGWHADVQTLIDAADRDECYRWSLFSRPPLSNWSTRRVTLLGDAAHPTLPYLAQGAAMAIEDGVVLTRALDMSPSISDALQLYQRNRIGRTSRIVEQSAANRALFHMRDTHEIRAHFAKTDEGAVRNTWLYSYNPLTIPLT